MSESRGEQRHSSQELHRARGSKTQTKSEGKSPQVIITESLESLKKVIELDTDSSLLDLSLLEKLNTAATLRYRSLEKDMNSFEDTTKGAEMASNEIKAIGTKLDRLENQIDKLLAVASEIDEWSKELEVKTKRYKK